MLADPPKTVAKIGLTAGKETSATLEGDELLDRNVKRLGEGTNFLL